MKIKNIKDVETFLKVVNECKGEVTLTSIYGDKYNLKSTLTQYVAVAALVSLKLDACLFLFHILMMASFS